MTGITIDDNGKTRVIADPAPLLAEQTDIAGRLERIYTDYMRRPTGALDAQEPVIVELVNRYHQLADWIDELDSQAKRRANIAAGWELLESIKGSKP